MSNFITSNLNRGVTAGVATVVALSVLGSSNLPAMEWAKQAAVGGISIYISDQVIGDKTMINSWVMGPAMSGATFAAINKVLGSGDGWITLVVGGAAIDAVANAIHNPLASALGM